MKTAIIGAFCFGISVIGVTGAQAQTGEMAALIGELERIKRDVADLQRSVYSGRGNQQSGSQNSGAPVGAGNSFASQSLARLTDRVNEIENELRRLTGQFERLQHKHDRLNASFNRLASVFYDSRNQQQQAARQAASAPDGGQTQTIAPDGSVIVAPSGDGEGQQQQADAPAPTTTGDERADFAAAHDLLFKGEFAAAESAFRAFLVAYPKSRQAGEAHYWIGESLFVRELFRDAAQAYLAVAKQYPDSPRAPDSLLKLADSFHRLEESKPACDALKELNRRYPNSSEAIKRKARNAEGLYKCNG